MNVKNENEEKIIGLELLSRAVKYSTDYHTYSHTHTPTLRLSCYDSPYAFGVFATEKKTDSRKETKRGHSGNGQKKKRKECEIAIRFQRNKNES